MNKPSKFALRPSTFTLALLLATTAAVGAASAQTVNNWRSSFDEVWKNGTGQYCWRDTMWTPPTGVPGCDGVRVAGVQTSQPTLPTPTTAKVVINADTFFDFDKATLKKEGLHVLDQIVARSHRLDLETVIITGHTDAIGTKAYNQKLSERRAQVVMDYLTHKGVEANMGKGLDKNRIYVEGKGESHPIASNETKAGRAKNRRTEIEVIGTSK